MPLLLPLVSSRQQLIPGVLTPDGQGGGDASFASPSRLSRP